MKRRIAGSVLIFEAIVIILAVPVAINVVGVSPGPAIAVGLGLAVAALVVAARVDRRWGVPAGWVLQGLVLASALVVPTMALLGAMFAALWYTALRLLSAAERPGPQGAGDTPREGAGTDGPAQQRGAVEES